MDDKYSEKKRIDENLRQIKLALLELEQSSMQHTAIYITMCLLSEISEKIRHTNTHDLELWRQLQNLVKIIADDIELEKLKK